MASANLGSIATNILARVPDVPATVSGALVAILDEERLYMEQYTGQTVGSVGIAEKYQPALTSLGIARALDLMQLEGIDATSVTLGDFTVQKGAGDSANTASDRYRKDAMEKMRALGVNIRFTRIIGG